jgi:hypothetical protein
MWILRSVRLALDVSVNVLMNVLLCAVSYTAHRTTEEHSSNIYYIYNPEVYTECK